MLQSVAVRAEALDLKEIRSYSPLHNFENVSPSAS